MDNIQLKELFDSVVELPNAFDRALKLKEIKKEYKTSAFYKQTRMPIYRAYEWFIKDSIANTAMSIKKFRDAQYIGEYITDLIDHISPDAVEDLMVRITEYLDTSKMVAASAEIGEQLKKLQR